MPKLEIGISNSNSSWCDLEARAYRVKYITSRKLVQNNLDLIVARRRAGGQQQPIAILDGRAGLPLRGRHQAVQRTPVDLLDPRALSVQQSHRGLIVRRQRGC